MGEAVTDIRHPAPGLLRHGRKIIPTKRSCRIRRRQPGSIDIDILGSLAMADDEINRGRFVHDAGTGQVKLNWTAQTLGGAVIGQVTDAHGRVKGHPGLHVMDGTAIPGTTGSVNPSLTISALAERNIARLIATGG